MGALETFAEIAADWGEKHGFPVRLARSRNGWGADIWCSDSRGAFRGHLRMCDRSASEDNFEFRTRIYSCMHAAVQKARENRMLALNHRLPAETEAAGFQ